MPVTNMYINQNEYKQYQSMNALKASIKYINLYCPMKLCAGL